MKLTSGNSASARDARADKIRKDRAGSQALRAAFPAVRLLRIELKFEDSSPTTPASQLHELHPPALSYFVYPCPYVGCDGCFDLGGAVKAAIETEARVARGSIECGGARARNLLSRQPCLLHLHYEIRPSYGDKPGAKGRA